MQDKERKIREELWKKASKELEEYKNELLKESKEHIYEDAYSIAVMKDFTLMCEPSCKKLSLNEVKVLLKEEYPVNILYNYYMDTDAGSINDLYEAVWYQLSQDVKTLQEEQKLKKQNKDAR